MHKILDDFVDEDREIERQKEDKNVRQRQMYKQILNYNLNPTQVFHALLRSTDHFMKAVAHVKASVYNSIEIQGIIKWTNLI